MSRDDGGPAFPQNDYNDAGMSLRDWFAGQALSMLNYHNLLARAMDDHDCALQIQNAAVFSYRFADAMLKARAK